MPSHSDRVPDSEWSPRSLNGPSLLAQWLVCIEVRWRPASEELPGPSVACLLLVDFLAPAPDCYGPPAPRAWLIHSGAHFCPQHGLAVGMFSGSVSILFSSL